MKKLTLDADALRVESFEASADEARAVGTVRGHVITPNCSAADDCGPTYWEATCNCANTSPMPSCEDCSWDYCFTRLDPCE